MKTLVLLSLSLFALSAQAALPPFYQSTREIRAILDNSEVAQKLGAGAAISSISRADNGYLVHAGSCALGVQVVYEEYHQGQPIGPSRFELVVGQVNCLPRE